MAKYRIATLQAEKAGSAGTDTIPINIKEPISRIQIKLNVTRGSNQPAAHAAADMTKIELLDGSDVLFSLTGYEAQALNIYDRRCDSLVKGNYVSGNGMISGYGLDFGRFLYDAQLALDPTKFDNLQLKITYTLTTADASGSAATTEIIAWVFDEKKITPSGFLMAKEIYSYTCAAEDSYEYIDFPLDFPIRKLMFRAYREGYQPCDQIKEFMIDENTGENVVMQFGTETYLEFMRGYWKVIHEQIQGLAPTGGYYFYVTPSQYWSDCVILGVDNSKVLYGGWGDSHKIQIKAETSNCFFSGHVSGYLPNHCFEVPFGNDQVIDDWYDTAGKRQVRLRLKAGSSTTSGTAQVVLQQYRTY